MALRSDLLDPISGDNPAGEDLRYDPIYDEIKQARFEEDDLPQGDWERERKVADYAAVIRLAEETLAKETKDLQLAAWLTEALIHEEGFGGLLEGLNLLKGLLETFWDDVYPEIDDGDAEFRAMPLDWVGGYLELAVKSVPLNAKGHSFIDYEQGRKIGTEEEVAGDSEKAAARAAAIEDGAIPPEDFESAFMATPKPFYKQLKADIDGSLEAITELDEFGTEKFGDVAPTYRTLRGAIEEVKRIAERLLEWKLELDPDPVEEVAETAAAGDVTAVEGGAAAAALTPEPTSRDDAAARLAKVARYLRRERPTDPSPYLMVRGFRWGELMGNDGPPDPRLLDAPPTPIRTRLRGMLLDARWEDLIEACESVMATPQGRGWLDLQRYVLTALDALGGDYETVAGAIKGALRTLLRDVPELPELVLMDDTPTANRETLGWLAEVGLLGAGAEPDELPVPRPRREGGRAEVPAMVSRAAARARSGDAQSAIQMLMDEISRTTSPRTRFLLQSGAARIMVESGLDGVARPLLEEMHSAIEAHRLEEWESGELVAQPLALLYQCIVRAEGEAAGQELYQRVCRLDPMLGIKVAGGGQEPEAEAAEAGVDGQV
ncbi:MAG: type VI secretion system protein TssA [Gemmatimonadota bacterium]|jgi:type VI secretion system protein ImpA